MGYRKHPFAGLEAAISYGEGGKEDETGPEQPGLRQPTMTEKYELSRRKTLAGLATIGAAGAGAGLGTSALFSDRETFGNNSFTAGTFDMEVTPYGSADQDGGPDEGDVFYSDEDDGVGTIGQSINIEDLKPGDTYDFCWCIDIDSNPGVVRAFIPGESIDTQTGAEAENVEAADIWNIEDDEEFVNLLGSEHITVENDLYVCDQEGETIEGVKGTRLKETVTYSNDDPSHDRDGGLGNWVSSLSDTQGTSQDGVPVGHHNGVGDKDEQDSSGSADPLTDGLADYVLIGENDPADYEAVLYCITINVSTEAGNELQGAELGFNLEFRAEQARHNDHPDFGGLATRPRGDLVDWSDPPV